MTIHAIYENGRFRALEPIDLPEHCEVEFEIRALKPAPNGQSLDALYALLSKRFNSGEKDVSARHNDHQP
jgi:predicted DNA-binding antitoxin AbrB/MazE fold protein